MLFINNEHHDNFYVIEDLIFPKVIKDLEYRSTAYLLALPILYDKYGERLGDYMYPTYWMYQHLKDIDNSEMAEDIYHLGLLSLHLWNGEGEFNLMDCMKKVDTELFAACMHAINIRNNSPLLIFM